MEIPESESSFATGSRGAVSQRRFNPMSSSNRDPRAQARRLLLVGAGFFVAGCAIVLLWVFPHWVGEIKGRREALQARAEARCQSDSDMGCQVVIATSAARAADDIVDLGIWQFWTGLAGVVFVALTLKATRDAVRDGADATKAMVRQNDLTEVAQRAWITIEVTFSPLCVAGDQVKITYSVAYKNVGNTIASKAHFYAALLPEPDDGEQNICGWRDIWLAEDHTRADFSLIPGERFVTEGRLERHLNDLTWSANPDPRCTLIFHSAATFLVHGSDERKVMFRAFRLGLQGRDDEGSRWIYRGHIEEGTFGLVASPAGQPIST